MGTKQAAIGIVLFACARLTFGQTGGIAAPPVETILDRYVTALGGRAALEKVTSMMIAGMMDIPTLKTTAKTAEYFKYPDHFAAITDIAGYGTVRAIYDGTTGWSADPRNGVTEISGPELSDIRRRSNIHWNLKLREFYPGLRVTGHGTVNGQDAWKLEATVDTWTYRFWFASGSGLLMQFDTDKNSASEGVSSVLIGDYRRVGDILFAFSASASGSGVNWSRKLNEVKFNVPIDDAVFRKPEVKGTR